MKRMLGIFAFALFAALPHARAADQWPSRTITLVAPGPAGGTTDIFARILAEGLTRELGRTVIVENRDGAGTLIGSKAVATSKPDGHTLLLGAAAVTIAPHMNKAIELDPTRDLTPIRIVARFPNVMIVSANTPVTNVGQLLQMVRASPGKYNFSSGGIGISEHFSGELFKSLTGADLVHAPFKGSTQSALAVAAGDALVSFGNMAAVAPHIKAGKLRAIAVTSSTRSASLPEVPTVSESGVAGYEVSTWFGLLAPAGTPDAVVRRLDETAQRILSSPLTRERLAAMGADATDEGPAAFAAAIRTDWRQWGDVVRKANLRVD
jgi:tripartite-type tricarboxylate transporter receptor subunit TctC